MAARYQLGQAAVDDMELWVIAEMLGVSEVEDRPVTVEEHQRRASALLAARVKAAESGGPPPAAPRSTSGPVVTVEQVEAFRRNRREGSR